jgi:predicted amidohydrolase YtcJ
MRQLFHGGRVFTSDPDLPWAEAVVIDAGTIVFVGNEAQAIAAAGDDVDTIDVAGGVVMPGFVDAHAHLLMTGASLVKAQLRDASTVDEIGRRLIEWRDANPDQPRVLGVSWQFSAVPDGLPTRQMLDAYIDDRPVYLEANDLHSSWVNTRALEELGITADTPDPIGGEIVRDSKGAATGLLLENASYFMVWPLLANVDDATHDRHLAAAMHAYAEAGVTTAVDMALDHAGLDTMLRADDAGALTLRLHAHWLIRRHDDPAQEVAQVAEAAELAAAHRRDLVRINGIKVVVDGTIDGCTAALIEPYSNGLNADPIWPLDHLAPVVTAADAAGLQVALHAIGDQAARTAIDAIAMASSANGTDGRRHRIEHLEYVDEADVPRLAPLGITASMQPVHINPSTLANWEQVLGEPRARRGFAWPEFLAAGTTLAFGTDTPTAAHEPLHNMYIAATRKSPTEPHLHPHRPDFALPLADAVRHGTGDAAWASFAEGRVGMLRAGLAADLIVLDIDPFASAPEALLHARVMRTVCGGRTVHRIEP